MRIYVVRHGETEENSSGIIQGHHPGKLTVRGVEQARLLALRLKDEHFDAIYCSDLDRAVETCRYIREFHHGTPVSYTPLLRERCSGIFQGRRREELRNAEKQSGLPFFEFRPEAGENFYDLRDRAAEFLSAVQATHKQGTILIVSHGGWNRMLLAILMGKGIEEVVRMPQENTCVNIIEGDQSSGYHVHRLNCLQHCLPAGTFG